MWPVGEIVDDENTLCPGSARTFKAGVTIIVIDHQQIDLTRLPSYGKAMGVLLRQQKALGRIPLVFVEGDPDKEVLERLASHGIRLWRTDESGDLVIRFNDGRDTASPATCHVERDVASLK